MIDRCGHGIERERDVRMPVFHLHGSVFDGGLVDHVIAERILQHAPAGEIIVQRLFQSVIAVVFAIVLGLDVSVFNIDIRLDVVIRHTAQQSARASGDRTHVKMRAVALFQVVDLDGHPERFGRPRNIDAVAVAQQELVIGAAICAVSVGAEIAQRFFEICIRRLILIQQLLIRLQVRGQRILLTCRTGKQETARQKEQNG